MRNLNILKFMAVSVVALSLAGCASNTHKASADAYGEDSALSQGADGAPNFYGKDVSAADRELLAQRTFYFDYDSAQLSDTDIAAIHAHARFLKNNPQAHIRLEGHTDERGTREYNIALGEHRAQTVSEILTQNGIPRDQISIVSFGKEKPASLGHEETSWSQNRRAIIHYEAS